MNTKANLPISERLNFMELGFLDDQRIIEPRSSSETQISPKISRLIAIRFDCKKFR